MMLRRLVFSTLLSCTALTAATFSALAAPPTSIVADGVPEVTAELMQQIAPYQEFRGNAFAGWNPADQSVLIVTRAGEVNHLHLLDAPSGKLRQLTSGKEPVFGGSFAPKRGDVIVYTQDVGGGEFFQLFKLDPKTGQSTLLTDGKSRNQAAVWSRDGARIAYASTRRNGKDSDIWVMDPRDPKTDRMVLQLDAGEGWTPASWSPDGKQLLLLQYVSANESYLWLADIAAGTKRLLTPKTDAQVSRGNAKFDPSGKSIWFTSDEGGEFHQLRRMDLASGKVELLTPNVKWDVEQIAVPDEGDLLAFVVDEAGRAKLHLLNRTTGKELPAPTLPAGQITTLSLKRDGSTLGLTMNSAQSPGDAWTVDVKSGQATRWTVAETGGAPLSRMSEPELVKVKSFDGLEISGFYYRPDATRFPGKRPVIIAIHGGPEGQSRPGFLGRSNYLVAELGIGIFYPNVRGSEGYGKTFLALDNGRKREDSVKDIGAVIDWLKADGKTDGARIGVTGGSYGGYMTLATMTHYSDRLRAGLDIVGISNFVTFLTNTQDYRKDLRRVEYGDERDPSMREFLQQISPLTNVGKISKPMLIVQGANDPRVPASEAEQMVKALRAQATPTWYILGKDEGHGFKKKVNADYQFQASVEFWKQYLLAPEG